jgi:hypothetical protein
VLLVICAIAGSLAFNQCLVAEVCLKRVEFTGAKVQGRDVPSAGMSGRSLFRC